MAGCECRKWKRELRLKTVRHKKTKWQRAMFRGFGRRPGWVVIVDQVCPHCGSKLTEEAGDAK
jgi:hypothetical protein